VIEEIGTNRKKKKRMSKFIVMRSAAPEQHFVAVQARLRQIQNRREEEGDW
jgi:hypothetical protein